MYKYEQYIHDFLMEQGELSLYSVGTLQLEKANENAISFLFDKKIATTPAFIEYVAEQVGKNPTLMRYNIESYLEQAKQFIHIGKPYQIPGIGEIFLTKSGEYALDQQNLNAKVDYHEEVYQYSIAESENRQKKRKTLMWIAGVLVILILGAAIYGLIAYLTTQKKEKANTINPALSTDTLDISNKPDSVTLSQNNPTVVRLNPEDSAMFRIVTEKTLNSKRAQSRTNYLITLGHLAKYDSLKQGDTTLYRIFLVKKIKVMDTAQARTYWKQFFERSVYLELMQ